MSDDELGRVRQRYARRASSGVASLYDPLRPVNAYMRQERELALLSLIRHWLNGRPLSDARILEVGCGQGDNVLQLIQWGADPQQLFANELLADRVATARSRLPAAVTLLPGDASTLSLPPESLDIVLQSTVFSSILDPDIQERVARHAWSLLKPGGLFLWYDFTYNNPKNPDVRGVTIPQLLALFPPPVTCRRHRITLAPPLARKVAPLGRHFYNALASLRILNTHIAAAIIKPPRPSSR